MIREECPAELLSTHIKGSIARGEDKHIAHTSAKIAQTYTHSVVCGNDDTLHDNAVDGSNICKVDYVEMKLNFNKFSGIFNSQKIQKNIY